MASGEVTALLNQVQAGKTHKLNEVYALLYAEIKSIAGYQLQRLHSGQTITPTVLAHECYLKLLKSEQVSVENKRHFLNCLSKTMRQFLIDSLRAKSSQKRKGQQVNNGLTEYIGDEDVSFKLIEIDRMLEQVEQVDYKLAELLHYKLIFNLSFKEIAAVIEQSERQVMRYWKQAKSLLIAMLNNGESVHE
jgi:RNA polymerase sigma factor (TIGR02999 family)